MCRAQCVLAVVALYVGLAHSWEFAVSTEDLLKLYSIEGTETDRVRIQSRNLGGLAYDVVHNRMFYIDKQFNNDAICGYNLSSKEDECYIARNGRNILNIAYDLVTEKLFFTDSIEKSINWFSLKRGYKNNIYGNLLIKMDDITPDDIAVDSCGGYIYWSKTIQMGFTWGGIERARIDGSGREDLPLTEVTTATIDPQTQKIYYFSEKCPKCSYLMSTTDMKGTHEFRMLGMAQALAEEVTVSKDYVYYVLTTGGFKSVWRFTKNRWGSEEMSSRFSSDNSLGIAVNYKIEDQIKGIQNCDSLANLMKKITPEEAPVNTGERCDVCVNYYCLHGNCSVSDEGLPKCSCNAGYSGERCEVSACYGYCQNDGECSLNENSAPICQCKGDFSGDRCHVYDCLNYCFQGNCSLSDEGHPSCSCNAGYSGERCEVSACRGFCLNDGKCFLNEEDEAVCECAGNHEGARCEADVTDTTPSYDLAKRNLTVADLVSIWGKLASRMSVTFEVKP